MAVVPPLLATLARMQVPEKPSLDGLEAKWGEWWETAGTYRFDRSRTRDQIFAIDTPPPTVSGSLHVGHVMSYTHTDLVARFQRMRGKEVFYPIGWDDKGVAYTAEAPTMWDVDFNTAVAQAEIEDREQDGLYHRIAFDREDGATVEVETSRPELLPACVALVAHPGDARYATLTGTTVLTPMFRVPVPVFTHELADPEKGTGIAMGCTFGD